MNVDYVTRALCFHGQPMQKIWEDERGSGDLQKAGVQSQPNYAIYLERQKHFTFQDRAKRFRLHQFLSRKADDLYYRHLSGGSLGNEAELLELWKKSKSYVAAMPPFELFINKQQEKFKRLRCLLESLKPGDIIYGVITKVQPSITQAPLLIKPLCTAEPLVRYLGDVTIKGMVRVGVKPAIDKRGQPRNYCANDFVCCEVVDVSSDADRLNLSMETNLIKNKNVQFGLVSADDLPDYYRIANNNKSEKFNDCLHKSKEFMNPNYDLLYELNGLDVNDTFTMMHSLKHPFAYQDYAKELRQTQASKWAFRSVAEGIEHFKIGRPVEAFQCLNKALNIDPRNVEGLVARGALYANKGSFLKAVDDFEKALTLNSFHVNARKYMGETLVALGRSYEEDNRMQEATKAYKDCLNIIPNHEQARLSLEALQQRPGSQLFDNLLNITGCSDIELMSTKQKPTSNVSSSSNSSSSDSESDSDLDKMELARNPTKKEASMSPLSKRMAQSLPVASKPRSQFSQPFYMANQSNTTTTTLNVLRNPNEFRLDDDDTESRVQKLLQEASKYKKEKTKKIKKKKSKKSKKDEYKERAATTAVMQSMDGMNFSNAYHDMSSFNIESKLTSNLQNYEKTIEQIKKRQDLLEQSTSAQLKSSRNGSRRDSPPPAPSMHLQHETESAPPPPHIKTTAYAARGAYHQAARKQEQPPAAPRLSFTIKRPVKVDKFGLLRIATPLGNNNDENSPTKSYSRSRSRSKSRHNNRRSRSHDSYSKTSRSYRHRNGSNSSRSSSAERSRRRQRRSHSRTHSRYNRSRSRSPTGRGGRRRRRTPSPFVPRDTPPRRRSRSTRRSRSRNRSRSPNRSRGGRSNSGRQSPRSAYGNRVWRRPGYTPGELPPNRSSNSRWQHDKFVEVDQEKVDDGPTIEEIDQIINKAQKERKEEIIKRDKDILKKPTA